MLTKINKITKIWPDKETGANVYFMVEATGFCGVFRIYYSNGKHNVTAMEVYFEGSKASDGFTVKSKEAEESNMQPVACSHVSRVIDTCLFVERKMQWILERLVHMKEESFEVKN